MGRRKGEYCPRNGCGMVNGTALAYPAICKFCFHHHSNREKLCPRCFICNSCGRVGKKYKKDEFLIGDLEGSNLFRRWHE